MVMQMLYGKETERGIASELHIQICDLRRAPPRTTCVPSLATIRRTKHKRAASVRHPHPQGDAFFIFFQQR